jgi:RimJ/RimL family protein N-acetyltransferase
VYRHLYRQPPNENEAKQKFEEMCAAAFDRDGDCYRLAVIRTVDEVILGEVVLKLASTSALQAEVGYIFNPEFAGHGYASEATCAMIDIGFGHFAFHRIFARLDAANGASRALVERLGFRREAHFIQNDRFEGSWGDEFVYAMLAKEWPEARRAFMQATAARRCPGQSASTDGPAPSGPGGAANIDTN